MVNSDFNEWKQYYTKQEDNTALLKRYPWLTVTEHSWLDALPNGWKQEFGLDLCEELNYELLRLPKGAQKDFRILEISIHQGALDIKTNWETQRIRQIIDKYKDLSITKCIVCGNPATKMEVETIKPYCNTHAPIDSIPINKHIQTTLKEV